MNRKFFSLGLMSGTSMDGVDASIIKSDGEKFIEIIDDFYLKYDDQIKLKLKRIIDLCSSKDQFFKISKDIQDIEKKITLYHVRACKLIIKKNKNIRLDLIGFHGQTILHKPKKGYSIQIGDSQLLSKLTNTSVISNFRENDISNGGQGAPLAPIYHKLILNKIKATLPSAIINIGGISNITYFENDNKLVGFDTGPGNYLIDKWVQSQKNIQFDKDGLIAKSGKVSEKLLKKILSNRYYKKKPPKSLDVKDFNFKNFNKISLEDGAATLSMLTVKSIGNAINNFAKYPNKILLSGGGRKNKFITNNIKKILKCPVCLIDDYNFNGDFIESQTFAFLAIRSYLKKNITYPTTTGVKNPSSGGLLFKI